MEPTQLPASVNQLFDTIITETANTAKSMSILLETANALKTETVLTHNYHGEIRSYSSCGEDAILQRLFLSGYYSPVLNNGFYVDIGAHHPVNQSNTFALYSTGWHGLNIEANPGVFPAFERERTRDTNINCAVSNTDGEMDFYLFGEPDQEGFGSSSTTDEEFAKRISTQQGIYYNKITVPCMRLETILDNYVGNKPIEFMNLDIEGGELSALYSNNWDKYRPLVIAVEVLQYGKEMREVLLKDPVINYLQACGYKNFSQALYTYFFYDKISERANIIANWGF